MKRQDYITWDEYFMGIAILSTYRSKDPNTQVGACIVSSDNRILSLGYNGSPRGIDDDNMPWERVGDFMDTKYAYVCHSELNAIINYRGNLENTKLYVTLFPCNECAKVIVQAGIKEIIYLDDKYKDTDSTKVSKRILDEAGVKYKKYEPVNRQININL
jgi:dCMP deaminase